jgi:hypothetical protein
MRATVSPNHLDLAWVVVVSEILMFILCGICLLFLLGVGCVIKDIIYPSPISYEVLYRKKPKRYNWDRPEYGGVILEEDKNG